MLSLIRSLTAKAQAMLVDLVGLKLDAFTLIAVICGVLIFYSFITAAVNPLRDIKGPFPARFTRLWELWKNWQGHLEHVTIALHERYGECRPSSADVELLHLHMLNRQCCSRGTKSLQRRRPGGHPHHLRCRLEVHQVSILHAHGRTRR